MANLTASHTSARLGPRRVLIATADAERSPYLALRGPAAFRTWDILLADSFERAHFVLQMEQCDVLLLDASLLQGDEAGLPWLLAQHPLPALFLADNNPDSILGALKPGATQWLPREMAQSEPALLSETLHQIAALGDWQRRARVAGEALQDTRRQVSRLVGLLWEVAPTGGPRWFTQRHMMERLAQEVSRCERHGGAMSVVLGEMRSLVQSRLSSDEAHELATWMAERITLSKRRCDVAGQYGPHSFMMILPGSTNVGSVVCCKRLQAVLEAKDGPIPQLQVSFGVANYSTANASVKALLSRAEERLELARAGAGERVVA